LFSDVFKHQLISHLSNQAFIQLLGLAIGASASSANSQFFIQIAYYFFRPCSANVLAGSLDEMDSFSSVSMAISAYLSHHVRPRESTLHLCSSAVLLLPFGPLLTLALYVLAL